MTSVPGQLKRSFDIPFERPRDLMELRRTPEFNALTRDIWALLREEVERARALEAGRISGDDGAKQLASAGGV